MRYLLTILLLSSKAFATNYYVANAGDDSHDGLTPATAWKTITKVNASSFSAGDSILFNRGDSWNEELIPPSSGTSGNPIVFGAYGTGAQPVITGLISLSLSNSTGNFWGTNTATTLTGLNVVVIDGKIRAKGRYPNTGYLTYTYTGNATSINTSLTGTPDYSGLGECVVRTATWILDRMIVSSQSGGTLNFSSSLTSIPSSSLGGNGFFFQGDSSFLDTDYEWSYKDATNRFTLYSSTTPTDVKVSNTDTAIYIRQKGHLTFDNLSIIGANQSGFQIDTSNNIVIKNSTISDCGIFGITAKKSPYVLVKGNTITDCLNGAANLCSTDPNNVMVDTCDYAIIDSNTIQRIGFLAGMGQSGNGKYMTVYVIGHQPTITNNTIDSCGYIGVIFNGDTAQLKNNVISNFCFVKDDGAGIYTYMGTTLITPGYDDGAAISNNIVLNGIGATSGTTGVYGGAAGIYLDNDTKHVTVDGNSIYNCTGRGSLFLNEADSNTITNNVVYATNSHCFYYLGSNTYTSANGNVIRHNQFYSGSSSYDNVYRSAGTNLGLIDSNYYSRPSSEINNFYLNGSLYGLAGWQVNTGKDLASSGTPYGVTSGGSFIYNPTQSDSTFNFSQPQKSFTGITYSSITLHPFTSAIIFTANIPKQYQYKHFQ